MSKYRSTLYAKGVEIYNNTYNEALFNVLESMHDGIDDISDFEYLKVIYAELTDEVDDEEFYDLGLDVDNHDLINLILDYCYKYEIDKSLLAINIGKYIITKEDRQFKSYEEFHQAIAQALKDSNTKDNSSQYIFLAMALDDIVSSELATKYGDDVDDDDF